MHQYLFYIGDFPIRSYGVVLALSIFLATGVGYFLAKSDGRGYEKFLIDIGLIGGFFGLLGARLWDVFFFDWHYYQNHLDEILNVWQGGMAVQGGIILGVTAGAIYAKKNNLDVIHLADILCPAIVLGQALGRCANLLNGDAFGAPTGGDFGIIYPETTLAFRTYGANPLFPAEVWECQLDIVIFALLLIFRCTDYVKGQCFLVYVMLYAAARFALEFLRGDYTQQVFGILKSAQVTSVIAFAIAAIIFVYLSWRRKKDGRIKVA
ncbi:MAG: prolipoprotein diacylglyceryl transferase [Selenomonadaceae bacterium]|nr:prolipoprotein diacylglyceryl transferase [Selenomonadaceae bacterium]